MNAKIGKKEILILGLVLLFAAVIRLWKITEVPAVINGDESGSLIHSWQILLGQLSLFELTHDGSIASLVYYPKAFFISLFGLSNSLFAVRFTTALFSLATLFVFYLILRKKASFAASILAVLLFASSYWYLNFSRSSWVNIDGIFWSLLFYYFLINTDKKKTYLFFILAGATGGVLLANYMGGKLYLVLGFIFLLVWQAKERFKNIIPALLFFTIFFLVGGGFIRSAASNKDKFFLRAKTLSVFNLKNDYYGFEPARKISILAHQLSYSTRGLLLFDGKVSSEGIENQRYIPYKTPAINSFVEILFYIGILSSIIKRRNYFFIAIYILNIFVLQILSLFPPSWGRAIVVLPAIYFFAGIGVDRILKLADKSKISRVKLYLSFILAVISIGAAIYDFGIYWKWVQSREFLQAQEPAITVEELSLWQEAQFDWIKRKNFPFTYYQWEDESFRNSL